MAKQESTAALFAADAYRRWQRREDQVDLETVSQWQDKIIANGDPECDQLIAALEAGWTRDGGR